MDDVDEVTGWLPARCIAHRGDHPYYLGACIARPPRRFAYRFGRCDDCGIALDFQRDLRTGRQQTLEAGTDTPHTHEQRPSETALAASMATLAGAMGTLATAMSKRTPNPTSPARPQPRTPGRRPEDGPSNTPPLGVPIWRDDGSGA